MIKGYKPTEEHRKNISLAKKGKKQAPRSEEYRKNISESKKGSKSHFWKGGITPMNRIIRESVEYKLWREAVFERDNYTCIWCRDNRGRNLNADHIKPFCDYPALRLAIDNGRTLCEGCHKKTDTFGRKAIISK